LNWPFLAVLIRWPRLHAGGRIKHSASERSIEIYGFSYGFPWADDVYRHDLSAKLCVEAFGEGYSVTTSDEGY
jgi:hypothetical protein